MERLTSKDQVLENMRSERKRLENILSKVSPEKMILPGVQGQWSVKDILAHIAFWDDISVDCIDEVKRGGMPKALEGLTQDRVDQLNENNYLENKEKLLEVVLKQFSKSFMFHIEVVEACSEEMLMSPGFKWQEGEGLWTVVAANSFWHYKDHYAAIEQWNVKFNGNAC